MFTPSPSLLSVPTGFVEGPFSSDAHLLFGGVESGAPNPEAGLRNIAETLGPVAHMRQIHGDRVAYADGSGLYEEYDALITDIPDLWLCVKTADCVPILLSSPNAVAAVHCGWRGFTQDILPLCVDVLVEEFGADPTEIHAAIGPHISAKNYPVGGEVVEQFPADYFRHTQDEDDHGVWLMSLADLAQDILLEMDVLRENIWHSGRCTYADEKLNSHRRSKHNGNPEDTARNLSLICLK